MLQEPTYLILVALLGGSAHGYAIIQQVDDVSGGTVTLRAGTLYGALDRLTDQGLVAVDREETVNGRMRRYYELTAAGEHTVESETRRRQSTAALAARRLRLRKSPGLNPEGAG